MFRFVKVKDPVQGVHPWKMLFYPEEGVPENVTDINKTRLERKYLQPLHSGASPYTSPVNLAVLKGINSLDYNKFLKKLNKPIVINENGSYCFLLDNWTIEE